MTKGDTAIREVIHEISTPERSPSDQLRQVLADLEHEFGMPLTVDLTTDAVSALAETSNACADAVHRVMREATTNALKHADASRILVSLSRGEAGNLVVSVDHDGVGFDDQSARAGSYGLASMSRTIQEARGQLTYSRGSTGRGVRVVAAVPTTAR